jgi:hypothetical protein
MNHLVMKPFVNTWPHETCSVIASDHFDHNLFLIVISNDSSGNLIVSLRGCDAGVIQCS